MAEPALPWANSDVAEQASVKEQPAEQEDNNEERALTLEEAGIAAGSRLEIKWQVEDEGEPYSRWWGATLVGPSDEQHPERPSAPVYQIEYDAFDSFDKERSHVIITAEHALLQLDQTEELTWRREGEQWDDEDEDEGDEAADGEAVVTMDDLKQMVKDEKEFLNGKTLEEAETEVMGAMEPAKRIAVASGYRHFADSLMSFLHEKVDTGSGAVVTEEHIQDFMKTMSKKQRTG